MVYAVKVQNPGKMTLSDSVLYALNKFRQAAHTQGYEPARIEICPLEKDKLPGEYGGVPIVASNELEPGQLRVCTPDIPGLE